MAKDNIDTNARKLAEEMARLAEQATSGISEVEKLIARGDRDIAQEIARKDARTAARPGRAAGTPATPVDIQRIYREEFQRAQASTSAAGGGGAGKPPATPRAAVGGLPDPDREGQAQARLNALYGEGAQAQLRQRAAYQQSTLAVAAQRSELREAGTMSQKFIDQAKEGNVTFREWGYQMGTVTAKFAGWAAAGSAVYAAAAAANRVGAGAIVSGGIKGGLGRSIENLDVDKAKKDIRDLSQQYNVSMGEAEQAVQLASQRFGNLDAAVAAAKVTLSGFKVGDLSIEDSANYTTALANGLGLGISNAKELQLVFDQINEGQNKFGVSIKDTFQGSAKAAGTWRNAEGSFTKLLALVGGIEKTTGRTGQQAGTFAQRSVGLIQRPQNQQQLAEFGINTGGTIDEIYSQAFDVAEKLIKEGKGQKINDLANALSTPQLAPYVAPLLANRKVFDDQEATYRQQVEKGGGSAEKELQTQLGRFEERVAAAGNALERLGGELEQSGVLNAVGGIVVGFTGVVNITNQVLDAFNSLPEPVRQVASSLLVANGALAVTRKFAPAGFGGAVGAGLIAPSETQALRKALSTTLKEEAKDLAGAKLQTDRGVKTSLREQLVASSMVDQTRGRRKALESAGQAVPDVLVEQEAIAIKQRNAALEAATAGQIRSTSLQQQLDLTTADLARAQKARSAAELKAISMGTPLLETSERPTTKPLSTFDERGERKAFGAGAEVAGTAANAKYARNVNAAADAVEETAKTQKAAGAALAGSGAVEAVGLWGKSNAAFGRFLKAGPKLGDTVNAAGTFMGQLGTGTLGGGGKIDFTPLREGARTGGARLVSMAKGAGSTIGPLGAFGIAVGGGVLAIQALKKSWKKSADAADHFASAQIGTAAQEKSEVEKARSYFLKNYGKGGEALVSQAESGKFAKTAGYGSNNAALQNALDLITRQAQARQNTQRADLIDSVTSTKGTGSFDEVVKTMRDDSGAVKDFNAARDSAIKKVNATAASVKDKQKAIAKINDLYQDTLTRLAGDALDPKTLLTDSQLDLSGIASAAQARIGVDTRSKAPVTTAIQANLALAAKARGKGDFEGLAKAREAIDSAISAYATEGLDDALTLARSGQQTDAAYSRAGQRLRDAVAKAKDTSVDDGLRKQMAERAKLVDAKQGQLATAQAQGAIVGVLDPELAEKYRAQAERLTAQIKGLQDAGKADQKQLDELKASRKATVEKARALIVQNDQQRFEAAQAVTDARNQTAVNAAPAGGPRVDLQLQQIGQKLAGTIKAYGADSAKAYGVMAEQQQLQQQAVQEQFSLLQARGALAEAQVSDASPARQNAQHVTDLQAQLRFMKAHPESYSEADVTNQMASIEQARRSSSEQVAQDAKSYIQALGEYQKSLTQDPLKQAAIDAQTANRVLAQGNFKTPADELAAKTQANQARTAYNNLKSQTAYDDIQFFASIGKLTREQEIGQLEKLLKTKKLNRSLSRQIRQQIYQLKNEADDEASGLDLNVADLKIPSYSQIRSAVLGRQQGVSITNQNTAQVYVNSAADIPEVARVLEEHQTGIGRAEARAMGVG
jgi:hypothetical protein